MKFLTKAFIASSFSYALVAQSPSTPAQTAPLDPNPSARFGTRDSNSFFVTGEALLLKPTSENIVSSFTSSASETKLRYFEHKFKPAVRVTLGYDTAYDGWDFLAVYTGLRYNHNNAVNLTTLAADSPQTGSLSYKYNLNLLDFDLGRMFKVSSKLKLRPHAGIRSVWLKQWSHTHYTNTPAPTPELKYVSRLRSNLEGLEGGLDTLWMLSKSFAVYANGTLASLYNSQKFRRVNETSSDVISQSGRSYRLILNYDFAVGLRWDTNFSHDDYHFGIHVGYEQHSFTNLNSFYTVQANLNTLSPDSNVPTLNVDTDLGFQGIALGLRMDF